MGNAIKIIKRLIAREGLVILSIIALGMISYKIAPFYYRTFTKGTVTPEAKEVLNKFEKFQETKTYVDFSSSFKDSLIFLKFDLENARVSEKEVKELGDFIDRKTRGEPALLFVFSTVEKIENAREKLLNFTLLLYPLYLLTRFIIWAIRTLKEK